MVYILDVITIINTMPSIFHIEYDMIFLFGKYKNM